MIKSISKCCSNVKYSCPKIQAFTGIDKLDYYTFRVLSQPEYGKEFQA